MFCTPVLIFGGSKGVGSVFMFCAPVLVFGGTEGVGSNSHVLRSRTRFGRYQGCRVPFSSFALPDSFCAVPRATGTVFLFCARELIFDSTGSVGSRFHVLLSRTRFRRFRGRRVSFSCCARPHSLSTEPTASAPVFMFSAPELFFDDTGGVGSHFHVSRSRTCFRRCRARRIPFSCFDLLYSFSAVLRASAPVFMFCSPILFFGGTEGGGCRDHVLLFRTSFWWYRA
jgi:hypothetical protein